MTKLIITVSTTTMALFMEKVCKEQKKDGRLIPLPKEISAGCGLAWMTKEKDEQEWKSFLEKYSVTYAEMVELEI